MRTAEELVLAGGERWAGAGEGRRIRRRRRARRGTASVEIVHGVERALASECELVDEVAGLAARDGELLHQVAACHGPHCRAGESRDLEPLEDIGRRSSAVANGVDWQRITTLIDLVEQRPRTGRGDLVAEAVADEEAIVAAAAGADTKAGVQLVVARGGKGHVVDDRACRCRRRREIRGIVDDGDVGGAVERAGGVDAGTDVARLGFDDDRLGLRLCGERTDEERSRCNRRQQSAQPVRVGSHEARHGTSLPVCIGTAIISAHRQRRSMATVVASPGALMLCRKKRRNGRFSAIAVTVTTRQDGAAGLGRGTQAMRR